MAKKRIYGATPVQDYSSFKTPKANKWANIRQNRILDKYKTSTGAFANQADALKKAGATEVYVFITHAVLSGDAVSKIKKSKIKKLIITDTIDNTVKIKNNSKIEVLSIAQLMAEAIKRISNSTSVSDLFN